MCIFIPEQLDNYNSKDRSHDLSFRGGKGEVQNKNILLCKHSETHTKQVLFQNSITGGGVGGVGSGGILNNLILKFVSVMKSKNRTA